MQNLLFYDVIEKTKARKREKQIDVLIRCEIENKDKRDADTIL